MPKDKKKNDLSFSGHSSLGRVHVHRAPTEKSRDRSRNQFYPQSLSGPITTTPASVSESSDSDIPVRDSPPPKRKSSKKSSSHSRHSSGEIKREKSPREGRRELVVVQRSRSKESTVTAESCEDSYDSSPPPVFSPIHPLALTHPADGQLVTRTGSGSSQSSNNSGSKSSRDSKTSKTTSKSRSKQATRRKRVMLKKERSTTNGTSSSTDDFDLELTPRDSRFKRQLRRATSDLPTEGESSLEAIKEEDGHHSASSSTSTTRKVSSCHVRTGEIVSRSSVRESYAPEDRFQVVICGACDTGKTSFVSMLGSGSPITNATHTTSSTKISLEYPWKREKKLLVDIIDTPGQVDLLDELEAYLAQADGVIVTFSLTDRSSWDAVATDFLPRIRRTLGEAQEGKESIPITLLGTFKDVVADHPERRVAGLQQCHDFATLERTGYVETSCVTGRGINEAFDELLQAICDFRGASTPSPAKGGRRKESSSSSKKSSKIRTFLTMRRAKSPVDPPVMNDEPEPTSSSSISHSQSFRNRFLPNRRMSTADITPPPFLTVTEGATNIPAPSLSGSNPLAGIRASVVLAASEVQFSEQQVGKGGFGVIRRGTWLKSVPVAIKTINQLPEYTSDEERDEFLAEIALLADLRHPNVLTMFGCCVKDGAICLVLEFIHGGDLASRMFGREPIGKEKALRLCESICSAMVFLHSRNIIHRDLKPENCLVSEWGDSKHNPSLRVCDFGMSKAKRLTVDPSHEKGVVSSAPYSAPELSSGRHSRKVDVFSFGIVAWELLTNKSSRWFGEKRPHQILEAISMGERPNANDVTDSRIRLLLHRCWDQDEALRPEFFKIHADLNASLDALL